MAPAHQNLKSLYRSPIWVNHVFCPDGPNNNLLSQGCPLKHLLVWSNGQNVHSKDGRDEEPSAAWVQLAGQLEITSS